MKSALRSTLVLVGSLGAAAMMAFGEPAAAEVRMLEAATASNATIVALLGES